MSLCQQPSQWIPGGIQVGIQSGTRPKTKRINRGPLTPAPAPRGWYAGCIHTSPPSTGFLSLASSWWCKSLAAGLAVFTSSGECDMVTHTWGCWPCGFFVCLYVESDRDREYAPQGDRGPAGSVQPQRTWSQQALGLWGRGRCLVCLHNNVDCWKYMGFFLFLFFDTVKQTFIYVFLD